MRNLACAIFTLLALSFPTTLLAEILYYTDDAGRRHYVDSADKIPAQYQNQLKGAKPLAPISKSKAPIAQLQDRVIDYDKASKKDVEIFVTSWCPYCSKLEAFLRKNNVAFTRYDIEKNPKGKKIYKTLGGSGIPVTRIGGKDVVRGYKPDVLKKKLGI